MATNYEMLVSTVNGLRSSKGMYGRMANDIEAMSDSEREELKEFVNSLPQFGDAVDVVMWLEQ